MAHQTSRACRQGVAASDTGDMPVQLYIWALPFDASSQTVSGFLWDWVVPESVHVIMDRGSGRSTGTGVVVVASPEDAMLACRAADAKMDGRGVIVNVARCAPRTQAPVADRMLSYIEVVNSAQRVTASFSDLQQELLRALREDSSSRDFWVTTSLSRLDPSNEQRSREPMRRQVAWLVEEVARNPALLVELHPQLFEHMIAALLRSEEHTSELQSLRHLV